MTAFDAADPDAQPAGTETVYDALGRAAMTRQWNNVRLNLKPFKVNSQGQAVFEGQAGYTAIAGAPAGMSVPSGITVTGAWDGTGTQPADIGWTAGGVLPAAGNEAGRSETQYDSAGRVWKTWTMNADRQMVCTNQYTYDLAGRQVDVITLPGTDDETVTTTEYDGSRRWKVTDGQDKTTEFKYDELGRVTTTIHPATSIDGGAAQITYSHVSYDGMGRKEWEAVQTVHDGTTAHPVLDSEKKFYGYDYAGRLAWVKMPAVDNPENSYNSTNPLYNYYYDSYGDQVCILDDKGMATLFEYDYMHRLVKKYQPYQTSFTPSTTQTRPTFSDTDTDPTNDIRSQKPTDQPYERNWYNPEDGRIWKEKDCKGQYTLYYCYNSTNSFTGGNHYGAPGQLRCRDYYASDPCPANDLDNPAAAPDPDTANQYRRERFAYTYDRLGRRVTETVFDCTTNPVTESYYAQYGYDDNGQLTSILTRHNGISRIIQYVYDPVTGQKTDTQVWAEKLVSGQMTWVEDTSTDYDYDALGRLLFVTADKRNESDINEQTTYSYDLVGNRKSTTLPNGVYTWYDYNALNRLTTLKHFSQYEATPTNDTYRISSFAYKLNAQGMRTGITEYVRENRYLAYQYDALNRLMQEDSYSSANLNPATDDGYTAKYEFDIAGNRLGRQVTVVRNSSSPTSNVLSTDYTQAGVSQYDAGDRLRKEYNLDTAIFAAIPQGENDRIFACADGQGGFGYKLPDSASTISQFKAFLMGLPSVWNRWILIALMVLVPVAFLWPSLWLSFQRMLESSSIFGFRIKSGMTKDEERPTLSLYHRSLCILFAYIFLIGPEVIQTLAYTDTQYHQLSTQAWGHAGDYTTYYYDANGSLTYKIYSDQNTTGDPAAIVAANTSLKYDKSDYSLQNRLSKLTQYSKPAADAIRLITEYAYAPDGIRVGSKSYKTVNNGTAQEKTTTDYLVDPANHTGYAQVLEERTTAYNTSDVPTTQNRIAYTIGDDIISQAISDWTWNQGTSAWVLTTPHDTEYLLYDGQGSTRQLVRPNKTVIENYNYDSYGIMLGGNPTAAAPAATKLLYTGEQFDTAAQSYYLRARYYDPMNGRFTQMDTYAGDAQSPQSLHKYTYVHNDPVNYTDPSGYMTLGQTLTVLSVTATLISVIAPIGCGLIAAHRAGVGLKDFMGELTKWETWAEALIAIGFGCLATAAIKQIALWFGIKVFVLFGFIMSIVNCLGAIQLSNDMLNGKMPEEEIKHFLAVMTATIVLTVIVGFVLYKHEQYYSETKRSQARGRTSEAQVLKEMGLDKNTNTRIRTREGNSIPDALTDELLVEIKDRKLVANTKQLRIQTQGAGDRETMLVTGMLTEVDPKIASSFSTIIRRPDLGPGTSIFYLQMVKSVALNKIFLDCGYE